jgi:hypothetical protein
MTEAYRFRNPGRIRREDPNGFRGGTITREEYMERMEGRNRPLTDNPMQTRMPMPTNAAGETYDVVPARLLRMNQAGKVLAVTAEEKAEAAS